MRVISKIFSILFVLSVLLVLFVPSVKAQCACKSHCSGSEELVDLCTNPYKKYYCCKIHQPTSTPKPTNTPASQNCNWIGYTCVGSCAAGYSCTAVGSYTCACVANTQPTETRTPLASPTVTPAGGCWCQNGKCVGNLTKCTYTVSGCSQTCSDPAKNATIKEYCTTTNQTCSIKPCAGYSASCVSNCKKGAPGCVAITVPADCAYNAPGCNVCGYARTEAIYCYGVHCGDTCAPNALCSNSPWCSGGGGTNPTNTPAPIPNPSSVCDPFSPKKT